MAAVIRYLRRVAAACLPACMMWASAHAVAAAAPERSGPGIHAVRNVGASSRSFGFVTEWPYIGEHGSAEGFAVDDSGNVFLATMDRAYRYTSRGAYVCDWGGGGDGGEEFGEVGGIAVDRSGHVYVLDSGWSCVRKFTGIGVPITTWGSPGTGPGEFGYYLTAIATDDSGNVYVADMDNCRIEKFSSSGDYITQWGRCGTGDGEFTAPVALAIDRQGHVYVCDGDSPRVQQFTTDGVHVATWAVDAEALAVDAGANLYAVDEQNHQIVHLDATGHELDRWGSFGWESGQFLDPMTVAVDGHGSVLVADSRRIQEFGVADRWRVTATAGPHGRIVPDTVVNVAEGMSQSYLAVPDLGYRIAGVTVDGVPVGTSAAYTFTDVAAEHAIEASFTPLVGWPRDSLINLPVATAEGWPRSLRVVSDGAGGTFFAWSDYRSVNGTWMFDVRLQRVTALGQVVWPPRGISIHSATVYLATEGLVADGSGGAIVLWADNPDDWNNWDLHVQRVNADGSAQWGPNGVTVCPDPYNQSDAVMVTDASGGVIVSWSVNINGAASNLVAQRVDASGTARWGTEGLQYRSHNWVEHPTLTPDGGGGAFVLWGETHSYYDLYAQRLGGDGTVLWAPGGVPVCMAAWNQAPSALVPDGSGGAIAVWLDWRSTPPDSVGMGVDHIDLYAQRLSASGLPLWATNGVPVCTAPGDQRDACAAGDGSGGVLVAWQDERSGYDVYVQKVSAAGAPLWTADGVALGAPGAQKSMGALVPDGAGGLIAAWEETREFAEDVVAQRVGATGAPCWPPGGVVLSAGRGIRQEVVLTGDGFEGAIAAWIDSRDFYNAVYAQRVDRNGWLGGAAVNAVPTGAQRPVVRLESVAPNPHRAGPLNVRLSLASAAQARLELLDVAGRRVALHEVGRLGAGPHSVELGEGARLAPGLYFVRLVQGHDTSVARFIVLH